MKPSELSSLLPVAFKNRMPVLITGAPGIGKSDIVAQAAEKMEMDTILCHPAVADPTDAKGLPWVVDGRATFLPFGELEQAIHTTTPTVMFLDDLGQASPAVQASYMQLLLARRVNGHKLSEHVTFVAATNRRTDRAGVSGLLEPVKSRFGCIVELEPDLEEWIDWALAREVNFMLPAFLRFRPDLLNKFEATADLTNSPVPRTWSHVAKILEMPLSHNVQTSAINGAVGAGAGTEFLAYMRLCEELPNIDLILKDPAKGKIPEKAAVLYAVASALATKVTEKTFANVTKYVQRLVDANKGEFGVLTIRDAVRRHNELTETAEFDKLVSGELGQLISGGR